MSAEPNQFRGFSELLNNQRQSLHFSVASCSLLPLLGRDCHLFCICTAAGFVGCHPIWSSAPIWWYWWASTCRTVSRTPPQLPSCLRYLWVKYRQMHSSWTYIWRQLHLATALAPQTTAPGFLVIYNSASDWTQLLLVRDLFAITN